MGQKENGGGMGHQGKGYSHGKRGLIKRVDPGNSIFVVRVTQLVHYCDGQKNVGREQEMNEKTTKGFPQRERKHSG